MTPQQIRAAYDRLHTTCPSCDSDSIEVTCMGVFFDSLETAFDNNHATCCKCGWRGIAHDLQPKTRHEGNSE